MKKQHYSFTVTTNEGIARVLKSPVDICATFNPPSLPARMPDLKQYIAIWDTGATKTCITKRVVDECGLVSIGFNRVHHANGCAHVRKYLVSVGLPNGVAFADLEVNECILVEDTNVLIGMDIISRGDLAVTNLGKTVMSFRFPSLESIDFVKQTIYTNVRSGDPCPCGSGDKFKRCHGRNR